MILGKTKITRVHDQNKFCFGTPCKLVFSEWLLCAIFRDLIQVQDVRLYQIMPKITDQIYQLISQYKSRMLQRVIMVLNCDSVSLFKCTRSINLGLWPMVKPPTVEQQDLLYYTLFQMAIKLI